MARDAREADAPGVAGAEGTARGGRWSVHVSGRQQGVRGHLPTGR